MPFLITLERPRRFQGGGTVFSFEEIDCVSINLLIQGRASQGAGDNDQIVDPMG